jgi:hypothetical protein
MKWPWLKAQSPAKAERRLVPVLEARPMPSWHRNPGRGSRPARQSGKAGASESGSAEGFRQASPAGGRRNKGRQPPWQPDESRPGDRRAMAVGRRDGEPVNARSPEWRAGGAPPPSRKPMPGEGSGLAMSADGKRDKDRRKHETSGGAR